MNFFSSTSVDAAPMTLAKMDTIQNRGQSPMTQRIRMHSVRTHQTTTWERPFGGLLSTTFSTRHVSDDIPMLKKEISISYDYHTGGSTSITSTIELGEMVVVNVPPSHSATVKLMVKKKDDVTIPFTAKIKKTSFNEITATENEEVIYERGTWNGVLFLDSSVAVDIQAL